MSDSSSPHFLALDVGTTGLKALVVDLQGRPVARARRDVPLIHERSDWAAADAEGWWRTLCEMIPPCLAAAGTAARQIRGVGVTGLMHALVPTAADGTAV